MRRLLSLLVLSGLAASATVLGSSVSDASAQNPDPTKAQILVRDAVVAEPASGTTRLSFDMLLLNGTYPVTFTYSTALLDSDTAEAADFVPVVDRSVTVSHNNLILAGSSSAPAVEVRADDTTAADDLLESLSIVFETEDPDVEFVRTSARGFIADEDAKTQTFSHCALEASTGTLSVMVGSTGTDEHALAFSRMAGTTAILAVLTSPGRDPEPLDCGTPTVGTVDTIEVHLLGTAPFALTIDTSKGPFAPGLDHDPGPGRLYFDVFGPPALDNDDLPSVDPDHPTRPHTGTPPSATLAEDKVPEIEFDLHLPQAAGLQGAVTIPPYTLAVTGSQGPDHVVAGQVTCPRDARGPICRDVKVNLNAGADGDADVGLTWSETGEANVVANSEQGVGGLRGPLLTFAAQGEGGGDVLDTRGSPGTGGPLRPIMSSGTTTLIAGTGRIELAGGPGDDTLYGSAPSDLLEGGPGHDTLDGGAAGDTLEGGSGDDVIDEGRDINGPDLIRGGDGHDAVDYSKRLRTVTVGSPDAAGRRTAGEANENDTLVGAEDVRLPNFEVDTGVGAGGVRWAGEMFAPVGCRLTRQGGDDSTGPCPLQVDPVNSVGFAVGAPILLPNTGGALDVGLYVYDLEAKEVVKRLDENDDCDLVQPRPDVDEFVPGGHSPTEGRSACGDVARAAFDPGRRHLYLPLVPGPGHARAANCGLFRLRYSIPADATIQWVRYSGCLPATPGQGALDPASYPRWAAGDDDHQGVVDDPTAARPLVHLSIAWDDALDGFYASGAYYEDALVRPPHQAVQGNGGGTADFLFENLGQPLIVRQVKTGPDDPATDGFEVGARTWDLDLRYAGCGRRVTHAPGDPPLRPFVARVGNDLLAYCFDAKPSSGASKFSVGDQGYLVRIPLDPKTHRPYPLAGTGELHKDSNGAFVNYRSVRTPTLPGYLDVVVDPKEEKVLLVTDGAVNGNAVWVFDPRKDRFVGVSSGGAVGQPPGNTAVGIDSTRGRVYMTTQDGLLVVPSRVRPLPAGTIYPVGINVKGEAGFTNVRTIGVAPKLRRLFLPLNLPDQRVPTGNPAQPFMSNPDKGARYVVIEDLSPEPVSSTADPDANTAQVEEREGETEVRANGAALASGAHVVVTGGLTRAVNQIDPGCSYEVAATVPTVSENPFGWGVFGRPERGAVLTFFGSFIGSGSFALPFLPFGNDGCAADQVVTPGHREAFLAQTSGEAGSGSVASGAPLAFGANDVTANDVKRHGACERSSVDGVAAQRWAPFPQEARDHPDFQEGTAQFDANYDEQFAQNYAAGCDDFWDGATAQGADEACLPFFPIPCFSSPFPPNPNDPRHQVPDPRAGTTGRDGKGFPLKGTRCADFGSGLDKTSEGSSPLASSSSCEHAVVAVA